MTEMKIKKLLTLSLFCTLFSIVTGAELYGDDIAEVDTIVNKANMVAYYQGADGKAKVNMTIYDSQGRTRERRLTILRRDQPDPSGASDDSYCGDQKIYAFFDRPADVNRTVFLVWKNLDKDDDRWMYLPALDLVKRISSSDKRTSFVGSHFFYEDVSGRSINDDKHELAKTTDLYYVLKNTPKDPDLVEFGYYEMWIHKGSFTVVKTDYFDKENNKYRVYEAMAVDTVQGFPTVTKSKMTDLRTGEYTILEYSDVEYNIDIPEDIFTERYLKRTPRKYLK